MNKAQLADLIVKKHGITKKAAGNVLDTITQAIQTSVKKGDSVRLAGFGTFKKMVRKARKGINPSTGETLSIPRKTVPKFSPSKTWTLSR